MSRAGATAVQVAVPSDDGEKRAITLVEEKSDRTTTLNLINDSKRMSLRGDRGLLFQFLDQLLQVLIVIGRTFANSPNSHLLQRFVDRVNDAPLIINPQASQ
jgi:hypothetical protein